MDTTATLPGAPVTAARSGASALMIIHAQTALHPGTGASLGVVDLPIDRERHTGWPTIAGSSLKGVLRDAVREALVGEAGSRRSANEDPQVTAIFGPPTGSASDHAGALSVADARILAFPVRSMKGIFAWVTCMEVLNRWVRDAALAGVVGPDMGGALADNPGPDRAWTAAGSTLHVDGQRLLLEEFDFSAAAPPPPVQARLSAIADLVVVEEVSRKHFKDRLVILHGDDFTHFVRHATSVQARIAIDYDTKTVTEGALFYEEYLPPETLLYTVVFATPGRGTAAITAREVLEKVRTTLARLPYLQIGGGQTTGKGICTVALSKMKENP